MSSTFERHPGPYHIHIVPHSHLDIEWYWAFDKTRAWSRTIFRDMVRLLREHPAEAFTQDQVPLLEIVAELAEPDELRRWIAEGRLEAACGGYVQPEVAEPHGECLIRNLLLGRKRTRQLVGAAPTTGWFVDTFGQIRQIAQILVGCGITSWVFMRGVPSRLGELPTAFWYESPDGTRILSYWLAAGYGVIERNIEDCFLAEIGHASSPQVMLCWGQDVANPADAPARKARVLVEELAAKHSIPLASVSIATPAAYFRHLAEESASLPVLRHDFAPPHDRFADLRGTYSNRVRLKLANRKAENLLLVAEAWDAIAGCAVPRETPVPPPPREGSDIGRRGTPVGQEGVTARDRSVPPPMENVLARAWEKLLYNHFHDIMGGSCTDRVYEKALRRFGTVIDSSEDVLDRAFDRIAWHIDTSRFTYPLVVFNPTWPRTDVVEFEMVFRDEPTSIRVRDDEGREVPFVVTERRGSRLGSQGKMATAHLMWLASDVPAFGYRIYGVEPAGGELQAMPVRGDEAAAENEWFRVRADPMTGDLASVLDKATGEEWLGGPGNEIVARREKDPSLEGMVRVTGEETTTADSPPGGTEVGSERTAVYERLRTTRQFLGCRLVREVTLYRGVWRIHFRTTFEEFRGGDVLVSVRFPVAVSASEAKLVYQTPYGMTERDAGEYHCAQRVVDLSDGKKGLALINTGNAGYWPVGNALDLVLFRSLADFPDYYAPQADEHGTHVFEYAIVPHRGDWRDGHVASEGLAVNRPLVAFLADRHEGEWGSRRSFVEASPANVEVSAIKRAEGGDGIVVRLYETAGMATEARITFGFPIAKAWKATMEEKQVKALPVRERVVALSLRGHEIATTVLRPV